MGKFRKVASLTTLGLVNFHESERKTERRMAALTADEVAESKKQTKLMQRQLEVQQRAAQTQTQARPTAVAGYYQPPPVPSGSSPGNATPAQRMAQLDSLLQQRLITPGEHAQQRQAIINGI